MYNEKELLSQLKTYTDQHMFKFDICLRVHYYPAELLNLSFKPKHLSNSNHLLKPCQFFFTPVSETGGKINFDIDIHLIDSNSGPVQ